MKNNFQLYYFVLTGLLVFSIGGPGQAQNCAENLQAAQSLYEAGDIHEVEDKLSGCLSRDKLTKEELVVAYRLLSLCYLQLNEPEQADKAMLGLLAANPEYIINEAVDPIEFINLYKTFRTRPIFRIGLRGGLSGTLPFVLTRSTDIYPAMHYSELGFQVGPSVEVDLTDRIIINGEVFFNQLVYEKNINNDWRIAENKVITNTVSLHAIGYYNFIKTKTLKWQVHATLGYSLDYLGSVTSQVPNSESKVSGGSPERFPGVNVTELFLPVYNTVIGGFAVRYKIGRPVITLDARIKYGFHNIMRDEDTLKSSGLYEGQGHGNFNKDESLQNANVNLGLQLPIFNHKKLDFDGKDK